ncbi:MAG: hypothetical protein ACFCVF_15790 [Kineosporiaceae bacterium]
MTAEEMARDYGPYDEVSLWLTVHEPDGRVIAGSRLIPPNSLGQKSLDDVSRPPWRLDASASLQAAGLTSTRTWDVATLFRDRHARHSGMHVTAALCYAIIQTIRHNGGNALVAVLDSVAREMLDRFFALRVRMLPGATRQMFMNTPNDPTFAFLSEMLEHSRRVNPEGHRMYALGSGIHGVELPAPPAFARGIGGAGRPSGVIDLRGGDEEALTMHRPGGYDATT